MGHMYQTKKIGETTIKDIRASNFLTTTKFQTIQAASTSQRKYSKKIEKYPFGVLTEFLAECFFCPIE